MKVRTAALLGLSVAGAALAARLLLFRPVPVDVRAARVAAGKVEQTVASTKAGAIRSRWSAALSVEQPGLVVAIHAREGARVRKGDHLLSLDRRDADAALVAARTELRVLEALTLEVRARLREAERERERVRTLRASGTATASQLDAAETQAEVAGVVVAAAEARVEAQRAVVGRAEVVVDKCDLHAPFDGVVAERLVELGEWALPGQVALRLFDPADLYVRAELDEVDIGPITTGLVARVTLDPWKDRKLLGTIIRVAPSVSEVQEQNRTVEVEVALVSGHEGLELKPGTSADVEVVIRELEGVLRIPAFALTEGGRVLVVAADGHARATPVAVGLKNWEWAQVLSGLAAGDRVIVSLESEAVKDGALLGEVREAER